MAPELAEEQTLGRLYDFGRRLKKTYEENREYIEAEEEEKTKTWFSS